jgi:hypothetical protein
MVLADLPPPDPTYTICATTHVFCCPQSTRISTIANPPLSNGELLSFGPCRLRPVAHYASVVLQIYPDPPSIIMQDSYQTLRHSSAPSLCLSESTRLPSVIARPSVHSSSSSDDHTAVSSHGGIGSWYLPDDLQAEWDLGLGLQNGKKGIFGSKEANGQTNLPMHYVPASRLRKTKRRTCSGMLWNAVTSFGRGVVTLFVSKPMDVSPATR